MATIPIPHDFSEFLKLLQGHKVKYLLIGGYAVCYHGHVRSTGDMDIWVEKSAENAEKLVKALHEFGFQDKALEKEAFLKSDRIVRMGVPPVRIEIMNTITGVNFQESYEGRIEDQWNGVKVNIISLEKLRQNKRATGRLKDLSDLDHL